MLQHLERVCATDGQYSANIISSIYFDTVNHDFAMEKAASDYLKTKIRVRWYADSEGSGEIGKCFLEVKRKIGSTRLKQR